MGRLAKACQARSPPLKLSLIVITAQATSLTATASSSETGCNPSSLTGERGPVAGLAVTQQGVTVAVVSPAESAGHQAASQPAGSQRRRRSVAALSDSQLALLPFARITGLDQYQQAPTAMRDHPVAAQPLPGRAQQQHPLPGSVKSAVLPLLCLYCASPACQLRQ